MKFELAFLLADPRFMARDGDDGAPDDDGQVDPPDDGGQDDPPVNGEGKFTQDQVNDIVVKRVKKVRSQLEQAEKRYEQLLTSQNLTAQEKDELKSELSQVQSQLRTKEQQAAYEAKRREEEFQKNLEKTVSERDRFKSLFETQTRDNAIIAAASKHGGYNPEQFISLLSPRTEIVAEKNDQGEETGRLVPRVRTQVKAEDGTAAEVLLSPEEAIENMKQDVEKYGNLFRGNVARGIGEGSNNSVANGGARADLSKISDAEYFKNRDAYAGAYGLKPKNR